VAIYQRFPVSCNLSTVSVSTLTGGKLHETETWNRLMFEGYALETLCQVFDLNRC
jgi:hypothetical protein